VNSLKTTLFLALCASTLFLAACGGGGGGGGKGFSFGGGTVNPYDIQAVSPPVNGVQVNRAFSITVNFFAPGTVTPFNVPANETIHCTLVSGPGTLSGTVSQPGNNTPSLTFNNLILSAQGSYVLSFNGLKATGPAATAAFNVGAQMDLRFVTVPAGAMTGQTFTVSVQTVQPGTTTPVVPAQPVAITIARATGTSALAGTTTVNTSGSTATFSVSYPVAEIITISASAFGFPTITSGNITIDSVVMTFAGTPAFVLVNGTFSLTVNLTGAASGTPISPSPAIQASLTVASGGGTLTGNTTNISSVGSTVTFTNLRYNQVGAATFQATSTSAATPATSPTINFGVDLTVTATGPTTVGVGVAFSPFQFRVLDGTGAVWTGTVGSLSWVLTNSASATVQSGSAGFTAGVASVTPAPIGTAGSYTLTGSITTPNTDSANIGIGVTSFTLFNQPGPFVALKSVRVGTPYNDSVAVAAPTGITSYALLSGSLPAGLTLTAGSGVISGTPTTAGSYAFTLAGVTTGSNAQPIRCALAVFSVAETEIVAGQSFKTPGPYQVSGPFVETFTFTSSFDGITWAQGGTPACRIQIYYPNFAGTPTPPSPAPMVVHHRGRGFVYTDYDNLGAHLASYGFIFVSVEDYQSVYTPLGSPYDTYTPYDDPFGPSPYGDIARTHVSAAAFQEGAMNRLLTKNATSSDSLFNRIDTSNIFMAGHSRGGGATHYSHLRGLNLKLKGVIYFMAFDLRNFAQFVTGSGTAPAYSAMPTAQPRLPSLAVAGEQDGDLIYPICDQMMDRSTGQATFATIYGANHNYLGDANGADGAPYITRQQEQERIFDLVVAFLKRWTALDLSLEGKLYNNEHAGSSEVGVTAYRNMMERVLVDDNQNNNVNTNLLGGANSITGGTVSESASVFPNIGTDLPSLGLRHAIYTIASGATCTHQINIPAANQNMSRTKRLVFRFGAIDATGQPKGFDWVTVRVRITAGATSTVTIFDRSAPTSTYLPDYPGSGSNVYDRFVEASISLSQFSGLTLSTVSRVELIFETATGASRQLYMDDIRFE